MVTINLAGTNGNSGTGFYSTGVNKKEEKEGQVKNGAIFAGDIHPMAPDRIGQKRAEARKQANKIIMDQFASDNGITDQLNGLRDKFKDLHKETASLKEERKSYDDLRNGLAEKYGITKDSEEYRNLELIRKAQKDGVGNLNEEELDQLANMGELTDYQSEALYFDEMVDTLDSLIEEYETQARGVNQAISATKQGMLENWDGMTNARKTSDKIMAAASKVIMGMTYSDAKKHIDEEFEKLVEAAKEAAEKKEEEEEKLEAVKEEKKEQEELTETIQESTAKQDKLKAEIDKIMKEADLLKEDVKGLVVDGQL